MRVILPLALGGSMILCSMRLFSGTMPKMSPPEMWSPTLNWFTVGRLNSHAAERSTDGTLIPRGMKQSPATSAIFLSGRWMPSKMFPITPGPSSTERGCLDRATGSPTVSPEVSS